MVALTAFKPAISRDPSQADKDRNAHGMFALVNGPSSDRSQRRTTLVNADLGIMVHATALVGLGLMRL